MSPPACLRQRREVVDIEHRLPPGEVVEHAEPRDRRHLAVLERPDQPVPLRPLGSVHPLHELRLVA
jgi:hypothetical protein